jgi:hypothetical protein
VRASTPQPSSTLREHVDALIAGEWTPEDVIEITVDETSTAAAVGTGTDRPLGGDRIGQGAAAPMSTKKRKNNDVTERLVQRYFEYAHKVGRFPKLVDFMQAYAPDLSEVRQRELSDAIDSMLQTTQEAKKPKRVTDLRPSEAQLRARMKRDGVTGKPETWIDTEWRAPYLYTVIRGGFRGSTHAYARQSNGTVTTVSGRPGRKATPEEVKAVEERDKEEAAARPKQDADRKAKIDAANKKRGFGIGYKP